MKKVVAQTAAGFVLAAAALSSHAAAVTLTGWTFGAGNSVHSNLYSGAGGGFTGSLSGALGFDATPFNTYCVELEQFFHFSGNAMQHYNVVDGASYFQSRRGDAGIADRLGRLMTWVADHGDQVDTAAESTSLQLAIWNTVYDSDYAVTTASSFRDSSAYRFHADTLLAGAQSVAHSRYDVYALERNGSQDFLLTRLQVPEPGSLALVAAALGGLAFTRRRKA
jgi:hypothetical protein